MFLDLSDSKLGIIMATSILWDYEESGKNRACKHLVCLLGPGKCSVKVLAATFYKAYVRHVILDFLSASVFETVSHMTSK